MSTFEFRDEDGERLTVTPMLGVPGVIFLRTDPDGVAIPLDRVEEVVAGLRDMARQAGGQAEPRTTVLLEEALDIARNEAHRLEVVAGIEAARGARCVAFLLRRFAETGRRPEPLIEADYDRMARQAVSVPRRLTDNEHSAAWHAIEGTASEEGADPGTVLNAVLAALGIDPPQQPTP